MNNDEVRSRTDNFKRNDALEEYLYKLNNDLQVAEEAQLYEKLNTNPHLFIIGPLRSGTTLLLQWLATLSTIAYPSNILSRFYKAPIIGVKIQRLLSEPNLQYRNEFDDVRKNLDFKSDNGKTSGLLSPNEFNYFWKQFIFFLSEIDCVTTEDSFSICNAQRLQLELNGISNTFNKPFAIKAMLFNYNLELLDNLFPNSIFLYVQRDIPSIVESIINARERQYGSKSHWYSYRIPEYDYLRSFEDPYKQVTGQVYYIEKAIDSYYFRLPEDRRLFIEYKKLCEEPKHVHSEIVNKLKRNNCEIDPRYAGPEKFKTSIVSNKKIIHKVMKHLQYFIDFHDN